MEEASGTSGQTRAELVAGFARICNVATAMECVHGKLARTLSRSSQIHLGVVVIMNVATAFLLAGNLREMYPKGVNLLASTLAAIAALCTGLLMTFDYKGKAGRHSELSTCYGSLALACQADMDRFKAGQIAAVEFGTILMCNVGILKELHLRSHGLDSSCPVRPPTAAANEGMHPAAQKAGGG